MPTPHGRLQHGSHTQEEEEDGKHGESGVPLIQYEWGNGILHLPPTDPSPSLSCLKGPQAPLQGHH